MAIKVKSRTPDELKSQIAKQLKRAQEYRSRFEAQWSANEEAIWTVLGGENSKGAQLADITRMTEEELDQRCSTMGVNAALRHIRFFHAQMSVNPPAVLPRPTSSDLSDRRKADAADRMCTHFREHLTLQEQSDQCNLKVLVVGTGFLKTVRDPNKGDILDLDPNTNEITMEGDEDCYSPSTWDIWLDPDACVWSKVRYAFERHWLPLEEAQALFSEHADLLQNSKSANKSLWSRFGFRDDVDDHHDDLVEVFEYYEKGLPVNGMAGCHVFHLADGTLLSQPEANPFSFSQSRVDAEGNITKTPPTARLPYHILTDIDVADQLYGKSILDYTLPIQAVINEMDLVQLENLRAHAVYRMLIPDTCEITEGPSNSTYDCQKYSGSIPPHFMAPPQGFPEATGFRDRLDNEVDKTVGMNESMSGQVNRELSGYAVQTAINAGNVVRRRLFNKYTAQIKSLYTGLLDLVRKHWEVPRMIQVLGKERAYEATFLKGADIDSGFDLYVEYGTSFSLDPERRREEIVQLVPFLKEAGMSMRRILSMFRLNELEALQDLADNAEQRQREIIEDMLARNVYIPPREIQEHKLMLDYLMEYLHTAEFRDLPEEQKALIEQHYRAREAEIVKAASVGGANPAAPAAPAAPAVPALPAAPVQPAVPVM